MVAIIGGLCQTPQSLGHTWHSLMSIIGAGDGIR